ncbi:MAG: hypothetical protein KJO38_06890, partial [Gammaproteobacteria bacterium]|nr:hypothetical protein [Gammaproteobacteria bacterium]
MEESIVMFKNITTVSALGLAVALGIAAPAANAATIAADYLAAPSAAGDEDFIAAFDTYITGEGAT